nr:prohibitin family protein [candidate division KSB1 bacterium]MDZ7378171.1 prohibitin family protein [candidate division KSB1 bacterium]MDZ7386887.1 prohibitin family protein [candidate division KSB1 bacterium]MDZ7393689.1 prohibitin family protein [candidate division KSB1 bacterium]MDZ7412926.1 prohibitin family protein [candidate division KSB1 bacterium]
MAGYIITALIVLFVLQFVLAALRQRGAAGGVKLPSVGSKLVLSIVGAVLALVLIIDAVVIIQAGTVGVVKRLGAVHRELSPGMHVVIPIVDRVVIFPTIKKTYEASDEPSQSRADFPDVIISALTADGQQIRLGITARFMIQPGKAPWILQNLGTERDYVEKVVKTEIRGSGRRVPTRFASYDLYTKRSYEAQQALFDEIAPKFAANGLILDELVLRNIIFTPEYARTLEEKQIALENITTEKNKLEQEKIRKEQKIVAAEADAKSIEIRQAALSKNPTIIQWEFVQKLAPNIQWGVLPQNVVPLVNLGFGSGQK